MPRKKAKIITIFLFNMTAKDNFIDICNLTTKVMKLRKGALYNKCRLQKYQLPRMVAAVIARTEEGIKHEVIAEVLNRHRASIYHYEKAHQGYYCWEKYRNIFNKIYTAYKTIQDGKKIFKNKRTMKRFLLNNGVEENSKLEANILIISGKAKTIISTSYMDFSNQLEKIKFALKEYKYEMQIL